MSADVPASADPAVGHHPIADAAPPDAAPLASAAADPASIADDAPAPVAAPPPAPVPFALDPRLAADTRTVIDLPLTRVLLMRDRTYTWLIVVPRQAGLAEILDLSAHDRTWLFDEVALVAAALEAETAPTKLNIAALGNQVRQLHVHVIARFDKDPAWPAPVWGRTPPVDYDDAEAEALIARLRRRLGGR